MKADNQMLNEYIDALELVKTNSLDKYFLQKNKTSLWRFINTSIRVDKKQIFLKNLITHFHRLVSIGIVAFLSMTTTGDSAGNLVFYLFVSDMVLQNSQEIESSIYSLLKMMPSFEHIDMILNLKKHQGSTKISSIKTIEFKNVNFNYGINREKTVIKNLNTMFKSGDFVRILGINGGGKSTFVKLMVGLLYPQNGEILLNGISLDKINIDCLKQQVVYIDQDEVILNDTVKNYIEAVAEQSIPDTELDEMMKLVRFDNRIKEVSESGHSLSGGQRKKLLMMKLLLRYKLASVIILDEIEAGLDTETKDIILKLEKEILSQRKDCIIFKISHEAVEAGFYTKTIEFNGN
jgi:ABC-type bacteriocin/lantibiotic exporter with double-glycine peptidase domain